MNLIKNKIVYRLLQNRSIIFLLKLPLVLVFLFIIFSGLFGSIYRNSANFIVGPLWLTFVTITAIIGGKIWCLICPWDTLSDWLSRPGGTKKDDDSLNLKTPKLFRNFWLAVFFFLLLIWLEYSMGLTDHPRLIAYLAIITFGITFISALFFYRKSFCRYGCPVGAICGVYGLFAPLELRSNDKDICQGCQTKDCIKGNQSGRACPVFEYPATMDSNLYCILCLECLRTCPNNNIALNLRLPAKELIQHKPLHSSETFLIITMLALSIFGGINISSIHSAIISWTFSNLSLSETPALLLLMLLLILTVFIVFHLLSLISRLSIDIIAYSFLPIALFNHLANTLKLFNLRVEESISLMSDPLGFSWNFFGRAGHLPEPLFASDKLIILLGPLMFIGLLYSAYIFYRFIKITSSKNIRARRVTRATFLLFFITAIVIVWFNCWLVTK